MHRYQRVTLRNMQNKSAYLKKVAGSTAAGAGDSSILVRSVLTVEYLSHALMSLLSEGHSHIFNGVSVDRNVGNYQLCDVTDPYLANLIRNEDYVLEECHVRG